MLGHIVLLGGDGIGPEVVREGRRVLETVASLFTHEFVLSEHLIGGIAIETTGSPLPEKTRAACMRADAVLLGAVGDPKWDRPSTPVRPEQGLLQLRQAMGVFANLRPVRVHPALMSASPLKPERIDGVDLLFVRELTGGLYFGQPRVEEKTHAIDTLAYSANEIRRVLRCAFALAKGRRKKLTSVDKANVLASSRLWRAIATEFAAEFPDVELEHQLVDSCAMRLISAPKSFDVIVTENMFGDILTDEAAVIPGSLGLLPSASLGESRLGLYEPIHGSAPDIAGKGIANPIGTILSVAMLLRYSLGLEREASAVESAVAHVLHQGELTRDLGGDMTTAQIGERICKAIH